MRDGATEGHAQDEQHCTPEKQPKRFGPARADPWNRLTDPENLESN
jgi:hypothetical protein